MSENSSTVNKLLANYEQDCLSCRIVSGCGLLGAGCYVASYSRVSSAVGKIGMTAVSGGLIVLGIARLLNLPPFRKELDGR